MSNHREVLVSTFLGFAITMTLFAPPIIIAKIEKAERIEAYDRSQSAPANATPTLTG
ncbi:hypothetical protein [uncultured Erythrobacter sp.]|uniref:hypothetical protein n=1 Tax=uncultured Erythrobacter sp. TaxID=263913 RepID=UPI00262BA1C3|nr:hypothetical protein [uncultured Erythrobacter sp.]